MFDSDEGLAWYDVYIDGQYNGTFILRVADRYQHVREILVRYHGLEIYSSQIVTLRRNFSDLALEATAFLMWVVILIGAFFALCALFSWR